MDVFSLFEMLDRDGRQPRWLESSSYRNRRIVCGMGPVQSIEIRIDTIKPGEYMGDYEQGDPVQESFRVELAVIPGIPKSPWIGDFRIFTHKTESMHGRGRAGFFGSDVGTGVMEHLNSDPTATDMPKSIPDISILFTRWRSGSNRLPGLSEKPRTTIAGSLERQSSESTHKDMEAQSGFFVISYMFEGPYHDPELETNTTLQGLDYSDWQWFERVAQHLVGSDDPGIQVKNIAVSRDSTDEMFYQKREGKLARFIDRLLWSKPYRGSVQFRWHETDISYDKLNIKYWVGINGKKFKLKYITRKRFLDWSVGDDVMIRHRLFGRKVRVEPVADISDIPR